MQWSRVDFIDLAGQGISKSGIEHNREGLDSVMKEGSIKIIFLFPLVLNTKLSAVLQMVTLCFDSTNYN